MCKKFEGNQYIARGWICHHCTNTLNGDSRNECKYCGKDRCAESRFEDTEVAYEKDGKIVIARIKPNNQPLN